MIAVMMMMMMMMTLMMIMMIFMATIIINYYHYYHDHCWIRRGSVFRVRPSSRLYSKKVSAADA